jgi:Flp pilus assembly protein TadG
MDRTPPQRRSDERGTVVVLTALLLVTLLGMAAFAVDLGWLYVNQLKVRKAAEAAALAGVVHMPLPNCAAPDAGTDPYTAALAIAQANGYVDGAGGVTVTPAQGDTCNQLKVTIDTSVGTFFMRVFGIDTVAITQSATAEQLPPLKIGSDESFLGTDPTVSGRTVDFWLAVNGRRKRKADGDPYGTNCIQSFCTSTDNPESRQPSYYYAVDVPAADAGKSLSVQVYDGVLWQENWSVYPVPGTPGDNSPLGATFGTQEYTVHFRLYPPDSTPSDWTDNSSHSSAVCSSTFHYVANGASSYRWDTLGGCPVTAQQGLYVLEVENPLYTWSNAWYEEYEDVTINAFSLRALVDGSTSNDVAVYGLGSMSIWTFEQGSHPTFKIVKLPQEYAGQRLLLRLFDAGDFSGNADLRITGELANVDCQYRVIDGDTGNVIRDWGPDDGESGCYLSIQNTGSGAEFQGDWVELSFDVPGDYTCSAGCWVYVDYDFSGASDIGERTTWEAYINGQPIHLVQ